MSQVPLYVRVGRALGGRDVTINDLLAEMPGITREQMQVALRGALEHELIEVVSPGIGCGHRVAAVYRGIPEKRRIPTLTIPVSCVWDLGAEITVTIPKGLGQIFRPLGEWEDTAEQSPAA